MWPWDVVIVDRMICTSPQSMRIPDWNIKNLYLHLLHPRKHVWLPYISDMSSLVIIGMMSDTTGKTATTTGSTLTPSVSASTATFSATTYIMLCIFVCVWQFWDCLWLAGRANPSGHATGEDGFGLNTWYLQVVTDIHTSTKRLIHCRGHWYRQGVSIDWSIHIVRDISKEQTGNDIWNCWRRCDRIYERVSYITSGRTIEWESLK